MASRWYCQVLGEQLGPVPWSDLVELVRAGTVSESDLVRRDEQGAWEPAEKVVGLFRAVHQSDGSATVETTSTQTSASSVTGGGSKSPKRKVVVGTAEAAAEAIVRSASASDADGTQDVPGHERRWLRVISAAGLVVVMAVLAGWWSSRDVRFPAHRLTADSAVVGSPALLLDVPSPKIPSVPNLEVGVATLVPGLEQVPNAFSPTLSGDLKTIVFAHFADEKFGYDLYLSSRAHAGEPFGAAKLIVGAQSSECDAYPTLSANGRELIFLRSDERPQLMHCLRPTADAEFESAEICLPPTALNSGERMGQPQLFFDGALCFVRQQTSPPRRALWMATRGQGGLFEPKFLVACANPWLPWFISANGQRAYAGSETGIVLAARQSPAHPFGQTIAWADVAQTGPVDGPLWLAPQEDVVVYSSAGPGKKFGEARQLWMWRKGAKGEPKVDTADILRK